MARPPATGGLPAVGCLANAARLLFDHLPDAAGHLRATTLSARRQVKTQPCLM